MWIRVGPEVIPSASIVQPRGPRMHLAAFLVNQGRRLMHTACWNRFPLGLQVLLCWWPQPQQGVQTGPPAIPGWICNVLQLHQEDPTQDTTAGSSGMSLFQVCLMSASKEPQVSRSRQEGKKQYKRLPFPSILLPLNFI